MLVQSRHSKRPSLSIKSNRNQMKFTTYIRSLVRPANAAVLAMAVAVSLTGCKKKAPPVADNTTPPPDATATPQAPAAAPAVQPSGNVQQSYSDMDAALRQKAYDKAVQDMLAVQKASQTLSDQELAQAHTRMVGLQKSVAAGVAAGDPNAIAAANLLRQAAMHH
jgi:predicted small lipoprotein YifL